MYQYQVPLKPNRSPILEQCKLIDVKSNHFEIVFDKQMFLHLYSYHFSDQIPQDDYKQISSLLSSAKKAIRENGLKRFSLSGSNIWSESCQHEDFTVEGEYRNRKTLITIRFVKTIDLSDSSNFKDSTSIACLQQAGNAMLKQIYKERGMYEMFGKGLFFHKQDSRNLPQYNIKILTGFNCTIVQGEKSTLLQIDFKTKLLNTQLVYDYLKQYDLKNKKDREKLQEEFDNKFVMTIYSRRTYRVQCIDFNACPSQCMSGSNKTYMQYYYEQYRINIRDPKQPLLKHEDRRTKKVILLVPELLYMTGLSQKQQNNFQLKKEIKEDTVLTSYKKEQLANKEYQELAKILQTKAIRSSDNTVTKAVQICVPNLISGGSVKGQKGGCFEIEGKYLQESEINEWILIFCSKDQWYAKELESQLMNLGKKHGIRIKKSYFLEQDNYESTDWIFSLQTDFQKNGRPQIVVSIMDKNKDKKLYAELKKLLIGREGVPHQNVAIQTLDKSDTFRKIAPKILLQIHSKLGKQVWNIPQMKEVDHEILVIGIDVYHKTIDGNKSCVGFNAQFGQQSDENFTKTLIVDTAKEINSGVGNLLEASLEEYYKYKKCLPKTIVVFRDGVGYSQVQKLKQVEINVMNEVINQKYNLKPPQFAYIMVNKRINDKFFYPQESYGIVVPDRVVTQNFDYFLIAQQVNQGTPTPTHYTVLVNTTNWNQETFWKFTYYQCYNYRNWSGPVKIPACVQNAHTVAYRVGDVIKTEANYYLERKLYFL